MDKKKKPIIFMTGLISRFIGRSPLRLLLADRVRRSPLRQAKAEKEGQISNQFKEDLFQIVDFLDENKREIAAILKSSFE